MKRKINENKKVTLTFGQLKKMLNESIADSADNGEYLHITDTQFDTEEDDWKNGCTGNCGSSWDIDDYLEDQPKFKTVEDMLKWVCEKSHFTYNPDSWYYDEDREYFVGSFMVNVDNEEASKEELTDWKNGEEKLWTCDCWIYVKIISDCALNSENMGRFSTRKWNG